MKPFIAIFALLALFLATAPPLAAAQTLADVAKAEEARRKSVKKPAKTFGNNDLKPDTGNRGTGVTPGTTTPADAAKPAATPGAAPVNIPLSPDPAEAAAKPAAQDEAYWAGRMTAARAALDRSRIFADSLQSRINALKTDFVNRDDPAQRALIEQDLNRSLAELEKVKKEMADQTKAIADVQEDARKAGVPAAWVR
jgi:hypothetical protein